MDKNQAARLLKKWISFNGMDRPDGWEVPPGEKPIWPVVNDTRRALEYAIQLLNNETVTDDVNHEQAISLISDWPKFNGMNDPDAWDGEHYPFVKNCMTAMLFTAVCLRNGE